MVIKTKILGLVIVAIMGAFVFSGCMMELRHHGAVLEIAPLPEVIEFEAPPYNYYRDGYYFFLQNDHWFYSRSESGPWAPLPRSHYPKEVRFKVHDREKRGESHEEHGGDGRW
jgi:hypothetical protein